MKISAENVNNVHVWDNQCIEKGIYLIKLKISIRYCAYEPPGSSNGSKISYTKLTY